MTILELIQFIGKKKEVEELNVSTDLQTEFGVKDSQIILTYVLEERSGEKLRLFFPSDSEVDLQKISSLLFGTFSLKEGSSFFEDCQQEIPTFLLDLSILKQEKIVMFSGKEGVWLRMTPDTFIYILWSITKDVKCGNFIL